MSKDKDKTRPTASTSTISLANMTDKPITLVGQRDRSKLTITLKDVMDLIPDYEGRDIVEYVHFQEGCKEALELIGLDHEKTLLKFLKLKLKGNARVRFSLHVDKYEKVSRFLKDIKREYNFVDTHEPEFWIKMMSSLAQGKRESIREYGHRCEDLLQCAVNNIKNEYSHRAMLDKEKAKKTDIDYLESKALYFCQKNIYSKELRGYMGDFHLKARNFQEFINVAEPWEEAIKDNASLGCIFL